MGLWLVRRTAAGLIAIFLASVAVFLGIRAVPGDPATALSVDSDPTAVAYIRHKYLLDRPLPVQYGKWVWLALHGDLGRDLRGLPVAHTIVTRIPVTLNLACFAVLVSTLLGIGAGVIAAWRRGKPSDYAATTLALVGLSVPSFWLGLLLIILFAVKLGWFPATGYVSLLDDPLESVRHLVLPAMVLGTAFSAVIMRQMRSAMLESLSADYVRTARAKGLPEWKVVWVHALRNSLITVTTVIGLELGALISGAVVIEQIFGIAGFGQLTIGAVNDRDYPLVQGTVLVVAAGYVLINLVVDVVYSVLDPRIRVSGSSR